MASFIQRVVGAAKLNPAIYEEVEADKGATGQAMTVVVISAVAAAVGEIGQGAMGALAGLIAALLGWVAWAFAIWLVGTKLLPAPETKSDMGELLRTIGFATSPGWFRVLGCIPLLHTFVMLGTWVWMLVPMVVAVRQALDYPGTGRAVIVCLIGGLAHFFMWVYVAILFGLGAMGLQKVFGS